jgi:acyl-CoA thioesterase II
MTGITATEGQIPALLSLSEIEPGRYAATHPAVDVPGRNIISGRQLMSQMIMAVDRASGGSHDVKTIHAVFSRAGARDHPLELVLDSTHAGRTFGSTTVTAIQGDRVLSRGMVLLNSYDDHLVNHYPLPLDVAGPEELDVTPAITGFEGSEVRLVPDADAQHADGTPAMSYWVRGGHTTSSVAANQAMHLWAQTDEIIELALRPHSDVANIGDAHVSISTGVISHTTHFHERFCVSDWLLVQLQAKYAGHGRVYGGGEVFSRDRKLVASFSQDSLLQRPQRPLDPSTSL